MAQEKKKPESEEEEYSLSDERRVKVLSPGRMVAKRFFRNRVAVVGLCILAFMFLFSFVGGWLSPYTEDQLFYRYDIQNKLYASISENTSYRYVSDSEKGGFPSLAQAQFVLAVNTGSDSFSASGVDYTYTDDGNHVYSIYTGGEVIAFASYGIISPSDEDTTLPFALQYQIIQAYAKNQSTFEYEGETYTLLEDGGVVLGDTDIAYVSTYSVQALMSDVFLTREFKDALINAVENDESSFSFTDSEGTTAEYTIQYDASKDAWDVMQETSTRVFDTYGSPSKEHWLGTDKNGMDMLTRLMYGGRVSLYIGFIVVFIETFLGVIMGGISGYFGGWVDMLIMRIVDVFYCIPSMPIVIIIGAAMDQMKVDPQIRMVYLMLILGFLGWPSIARMVRGQILTLREQEFMTAEEALGIKPSRRIFKHLIPNVIPQLIVIMTMGLGNAILTEATLSFLGLGVKFPFASWGNIINDVNDTYVLSNYWFIWIPAGVCLMLTVLAFNLVGDGLRDAFDPKMKR
ncbi:MAG: ABC transporter permease [Oscillospiraceae bacterium]|jgi:peptide/nickel transport system permease protein